MSKLLMKVGRWMVFEDNTRPGRKTKVFIIKNRRSGGTIGSIQWDGGWRTYVLIPLEGTKWNAECLLDVTGFIIDLIDERHGLKTGRENVRE